MNFDNYLNDPMYMQKMITYSFYMNIANCGEYTEKDRQEALWRALQIGKESFGLQPIQRENQELSIDEEINKMVL